MAPETDLTRTTRIRGQRYRIHTTLITKSSEEKLNGTWQVNAHGPQDVMPAHYSSGHATAEDAIAAAKEALRSR